MHNHRKAGTLTTMATTTQDLHIVIAAIGTPGRRTSIATSGRAPFLLGYTAVSAPLTWPEAQALWDRLDKERRIGVRVTGGGRTSPRGHVLHYMVRSVSDPHWLSLVGRGYANAVNRKGLPGRERGNEKAAKAWAKEFGYTGRQGGWIYDACGQPYTQGWGSLADSLRRRGAIAQGSDGLWYVLDRPLVEA